MPMKMGIHCKPPGHGHSASWIPAYAGMTGVCSFPKTTED